MGEPRPSLVTARPARALPALLLALAACTGTTQRSVRAPHASVPLHSGQALDAPADLGLGLANAADVMTPKVGNPSQAVEIPGTQARGEVRLRVGAHGRGTFGLHYEHGFAATSQRPDTTQPPVGDGDVRGYGASFRYAAPTRTPGLVVGLTTEVTSWSLPYVEYSQLTGSSFVTVGHGRANPITLGLGVQPSWRRGNLTVFGGAFARNHPTATRKEVGDQVLLDGEDGDVRAGPFNLLLHAGVEIAVHELVSAIVLVHQNVIADPVQYGPGVGVGLSVRLDP